VFFNLINNKLFYSKLNNIKLNNKYKVGESSYINIARRLKAASNSIYFNIVKRLRIASNFIYFNIVKRLRALFLGFIYIILAILLLYKKRIRIIKIKF
jgi:hypothetical protein